MNLNKGCGAFALVLLGAACSSTETSTHPDSGPDSNPEHTATTRDPEAGSTLEASGSESQPPHTSVETEDSAHNGSDSGAEPSDPTSSTQDTELDAGLSPSPSPGNDAGRDAPDAGSTTSPSLDAGSEQQPEPSLDASADTGEVLFRANFSEPNANGSNLYNFANRFANNVGGTAEGGDGSQNWEHTHRPTGGPNGTPCAHLSMFAGRMQYQLGWETPAVGSAWNIGDEIYFRFAIRYDDDFAFEPNWRNKFLLHGSTGGTVQSRVITYMNTRASNLGAALGWQNYVDEGGAEWFEFTLPDYFGLQGDNDWANFGSQYGSLGVHVNISWTAAGPVLVTAGNAQDAPAPGPNSAPPNEGWYYGQIAARSGLDSSSLFRIWVNNNNEAAPTVTQSVWHEEVDPSLGVEGWAGATTIGGYVDQPVPQRQGYCIAAFEVGRGFDEDWYPAP